MHAGKRIVVGSRQDADVSVSGSGVEPVHCTIENNNGVVTLHPINGKTCVDGAPVNFPVRLVQGKFIKFTCAVPLYRAQPLMYYLYLYLCIHQVKLGVIERECACKTN